MGVPHGVEGAALYVFVTLPQGADAEAKPPFSTAAWTSLRGRLPPRCSRRGMNAGALLI